MQSVLKQMLAKREIRSLDDKKNAIKETVQEVVLCGLARGGFFKRAAFYGGTALRIFYGLDRFSEDLDFSLMQADPDFDLSSYFRTIEDEIGALGLGFTVKTKEKNVDSAIQSAFLKGNTKEHILTFYGANPELDVVNKAETIKIKFEVDTCPPRGAAYDIKFGLLPSPYQVRLYDVPSLFAGKIHACLCRNWKTRVKGRDFYDYVFFLSIGAKVNLAHLKARLVQSEFLKDEEKLTVEGLRSLLNERFASMDFEQAKQDVFPFVREKAKLDLWSETFFSEITKNLQGI